MPWQELAGRATTPRASCASPRTARSATCAAASSCAGPSAPSAAFIAALAAIATACDGAGAALATVSDFAPDFVKLAERAAVRRAGGALRRATETAGALDRSARHQTRLVEWPLDIREALREQMAPSAKAWIFTSATLGDDERLSWFTEPAGLEDARNVRLGSPFDYRANARVFVPRAFPKPSEPGHAAAVARLAARCARALGGAPSS